MTEQQPEPEPQMMTVFLTNGTSTSAGPGPGPKTLPATEAALLVARKLAVAGDQPPRSFLGHPVGPDRPFTDDYQARGSRHDDGLRH